MRARIARRSVSGLSEREVPRRPRGLGERDEPELGERARPFFLGGGERLEDRLVLRLGDLRAGGAGAGAGAAGAPPGLSNE